MFHNLDVLILNYLLNCEDYITTEQLSKNLKVSRKTVSNHMEQVRHLAKSQGLKIETIRGKGTRISYSHGKKRSMVQDLNQHLKQPVFEIERVLFTVFTLLTENSCRIKDLESKLCITRPSVYRTLEKVTLWFSHFNITLFKTRSQGLILDYGEKRYRFAASSWYNETMDFLKKQKEDYYDSLQLKKCLDYFLQGRSKRKIKDFIYSIQKEFKFQFLAYEFQQIAIIFHISAYRIRLGYHVQFPQSYQKLLMQSSLDADVERIKRIGSLYLDCDLLECEAYYFFAIILSSDTFSEKSILLEAKQRIHIPSSVIYEIKQCLLVYCPHLKNIDSTLEQIISTLKQEIIFQAQNARPVVSHHYEFYSKDFVVAHEISLKVYQIARNYFSIAYVERFHSILTWIIALAIEKSRPLIKAVLVHDCNEYEKNYLIYRMNRYVPNLKLIGIENYHSSQALTHWSIDYDILITTFQTPSLIQFHNVHFINREAQLSELHELSLAIEQLSIEKNRRLSNSSIH